MTKKGFLKSELLKILEEKLKPDGFKLIKKVTEFIHRNDKGWEKYQIIFLQKDYGWEIIPAMLIRKDTVENIFHKTSGFEEKYRKDTPTIGTTIDSFLNGKDNYRFKLSAEEEIDDIAKKLLDIFYTIVKPFFVKYEPIEEIDKLLNNSPADTSFTGDIFKGTKAIILAKLVERNNYNSLLMVYRDYYKNFAEGFYLRDYENLLKELVVLR